MAQTAVETGYEIMNGKKPADPMILMQSKLITRDNIGDYKGWSAHADPGRRRPGPSRAARPRRRASSASAPRSTAWPRWSASAIC